MRPNLQETHDFYLQQKQKKKKKTKNLSAQQIQVHRPSEECLKQLFRHGLC